MPVLTLVNPARCPRGTSSFNSNEYMTCAGEVVAPGANEPDPAQTTITVADGVIANDGSTTTATVQLRDSGGVVVTDSTGHTVVLAIAPNGAGHGSVGSVTNNGDGTYTATVTSGTTAETATISGTLDGDAITDTATVAFGVYADPDIASHDFEDGTFGPFSNPWGDSVDVVNDPTGGGHGKVARYRFYGPSGRGNLALFKVGGFSVGYGQTVYFRGDFYLPTPAYPASLEPQRKMIYSNNDSTAGNFCFTLEGLPGSPMSAEAWVTDAGSHADFGTVTWDAWHKLLFRLKLNSAYGVADGEFEYWLDATHGVITGMRPCYKVGGDGILNQFGVGYQVNFIATALGLDASTPWEEFRYWDNIAWSTQPIAPNWPA